MDLNVPDSIESRCKKMCFNKKKYESDFIAAAASGRIKSKKTAENFLRIYKCPICDGFHLTSKKINSFKLGK